MKKIFKTYLITFSLFALINSIWLYFLGPLLIVNYSSYLLSPLTIFFCYLFYTAVIVLTVLYPQSKANSLKKVFIKGTILGLLAYSLYEFVNYTTLNGWPWSMALLCVVWGTLLTASVAALAFRLLKK